MKSKLILSTAFLIVGASSGFAQGFSGGELGLEYQLFDGLDTSITSYYGAGEFEVTPQYAVSADFSLFSAEDSDDTPTNITIHGMYKTSAGGSIGGFAGQDSLSDGSSLTIFGAEGAYDFGLGQIEGYFGTTDSDDDFTFIGAAVDYDLGNGFGVVGELDILSFDLGAEVGSTTLASIGGTYTIPNGPVIFARLGNANLKLDESATVTGESDETYFAIGASIGFGPDNGVTFDPRSIFSTSGLAF